LAVAIMGWCVAIQGAEIHEAAELGDLERVKAYLSQDPKQIDLVDAKGRTVLARAARSGKKELVEFLLEHWPSERPALSTRRSLPRRRWGINIRKFAKRFGNSVPRKRNEFSPCPIRRNLSVSTQNAKKGSTSDHRDSGR